MIKRLTVIIFVLLCSGCSSLGVYNTATGRREFIAISTSEEVRMGNNVHGQIQKQFKFSEKAEKVKRLNSVGQKLAQVSDRQDYVYNFYLIEKEEFNAFTTPGGNIYLFSGLMDRLKTDDQIASVLAHEIGHCAARHTIKKFQASLGYNLISGLIFSQLGISDAARSIASISSDAVMSLVFSSYSRKDEYEADRLGVKYLYLAGYDLEGAVQALEVLHAESKGPKVPVMLRSHPYLEDRIDKVKYEIYMVKARYKKDRNFTKEDLGD